MKKILMLALVLLLAGCAALADEPTKGIWQLKTFVDDYDIPLDVYYLEGTGFKGQYTKGKNQDALLLGELYFQENPELKSESIHLRLLEGGGKAVKNLTREPMVYAVTMTNAAGTQRLFEGTMAVKTECVALEGEDAQAIAAALKAGGKVQFHLEQKGEVPAHYAFVIEDAAGFDRAYYEWDEVNRFTEDGWFME